MAAKNKPSVQRDSDATKLRPDVNEVAYRVMREATGQSPKSSPPNEREAKNPEAVKRGRKGGVIGGRVRAAKLSRERRSEIARDAAASKKKRERP